VAAGVPRRVREAQVIDERGRQAEKGEPEEQRHYLHFKDVYINEGGGA